jgi:hypothetical protein
MTAPPTELTIHNATLCDMVALLRRQHDAKLDVVVPARDLRMTGVLSVVMRVAGPVPTDVQPHAVGYPEQQVIARLGDAVVYLTEAAVAARIRQQWDAAQYLVAARLPERISQTWLTPTPGTYPLSVVLRLTGSIEVTTHWISGRHATNTPAHVRLRVDRLVWQVCDQQSWRRIADAWFAAQQYLSLT